MSVVDVGYGTARMKECGKGWVCGSEGGGGDFTSSREAALSDSMRHRNLSPRHGLSFNSLISQASNKTQATKDPITKGQPPDAFLPTKEIGLAIPWERGDRCIQIYSIEYNPPTVADLSTPVSAIKRPRYAPNPVVSHPRKSNYATAPASSPNP